MLDSDGEEQASKNATKGKGKRRATRNESEKKRRDKLNVYITELASIVPTCSDSKKKLDKTTILKMAVNYMRIHNDLTDSVLGKENGLHLSFLASDEINDLMDGSLNSFLFALSNSWNVEFVSKSVTPLLGLEWEQVKGANFMDLVHPQDKEIMFSMINDGGMGLNELPRKPRRHTFDVRIACNPANQKIENVNSYETVRVLGYTDIWDVKRPKNEEMSCNGQEIVLKNGSNALKENDKQLLFVAVGFLSRPSIQRFVDVDEDMTVQFESRHTMDGKYLFVDPRSITLTGYWPFEVLGTSLYNYVHYDDVQMVAAAHSTLLKYGECKTEPYRMRSKGEQWIWMKTRSYISYNHWNSKPEFFCSTNMALCKQDLQETNYLYGSRQLELPNATGFIEYDTKQQDSNLSETLSLQQADEQMTDQGEKEPVPSKDNLDMFGSNSSVSSCPVRNVGCEEPLPTEEDLESVDSIDLSMSFEELESFIEAQRQLHDQLMTKHTILEDAIKKQKQQLQAVQQQMLLNLQAQLTLDPSNSKKYNTFEEHFRKAKAFSELQEKQHHRQKELVKTLKETRKKVEKHNKRQLKLYREKRPKMHTTTSFTSPQTRGEATNSTPSTSTQLPSTRFDNKQLAASCPQSQEHFATGQHIQNMTGSNVQNQESLTHAANISQTQGFSTPQEFIPHQARLTHLSPPIHTEQFRPRTSTNPSSVSLSPSTATEQPPATLDKIQNLLTLSSQNPQAMEKLLTGLSSQPDVAQTLLSLLKQAQSSEASEKDTLLFNQNLQQTTNQFNAALNTDNSSHQLQFQPPISGLPGLQNTQLYHRQQQQQHEQRQQLHSFQSQQRPRLHQSVPLNQQQGQPMVNPINPMFTSPNATLESTSRLRHPMLPSLESNTDNWTSTVPTETRTRSETTTTTTVVDSGVSLSKKPRRLDPSSQLRDGKSIDPSKQKDYFSNFTSKELEDMFITAPQKPRSVSSNNAATSSSYSAEDNKLQDEAAMYSPLLIQQQQLMQMHDEQRKQLLIRQQGQLLMSFQQSKPSQPRNQQNMTGTFTESNPQQMSSQSFVPSTQPGTSSAPDQDSRHPACVPDPAQSTSSWESGTNFELNDADEVVLNMLLTQPSMDSLLESSSWLESDSFLDYLNMNPDLSPD